ncbi:MAG: Na/Pi cotransporter family protein [Oscillospiraceae bacterium]|nr:Na/Pi cotransporter family protein [Oscillospiraceae bacterium]
MSIFDVLTMIGGLCLFLFGMDLMGQALERRAGGRLRTLLDKMTGRVMTGFLTGMAITAVIQSSSATTVMVVGFVNSGLMTLRQAINVIMGANVGTTVTAWLLSLAGISSGNVWIDLLKPTSFTPVLALVGIVLYMSCKSGKRKDTGVILLGFATLMFGMDTMSGAVAGLKDVPAFAQLFVAFKNPVLGVLAGAVLTGIIQSSSASVGILQALAVTGQVSYAAAIPIIMGQNIGTCVTALLSSVGTNKNAKRAAVVHLMFNVIGVVVLLAAFCIVKAVFAPALLQAPATMYGIAVAHSCFNVICTAILLPCGGLLEKLAVRLVPDGPREPAEQPVELDERLLATPPLALQQCRAVAEEMAACAAEALNRGLDAFSAYTPELAEGIRRDEKRCDRYEDALGTYLVRLSTQQMGAAESEEATELLKTIGDFERISDHAVNVLESAEELRTKGLTFSKTAQRELDVLSKAVRDILALALRAFREKDMDAAGQVEPLEQVIDDLKEQMRTRHILRLQQGQCSIETGFVWCDLLTDLERTSDHCSNIAGCVIDAAQHDLNLHETLCSVRHSDGTYRQRLDACAEVYRLPPPEQA